MDSATILKWTGWTLVLMCVGLILLSYTPGKPGPSGSASPISTSSTTTTQPGAEAVAKAKAEAAQLEQSARLLRYGAFGGLVVGGLLVWVSMTLEKKNHEKMKAQFQQNPRWKRGRGAAVRAPSEGADAAPTAPVQEPDPKPVKDNPPG